MSECFAAINPVVDQIERITGKKVCKLSYVSSSGIRQDCRYHEKVTLSNQKTYLYKELHLGERRLSEFNAICSLHISAFQRVAFFWKLSGGRYALLAEWEDGFPLDLDLWRSDRSHYLASLKESAEMLRNIHRDNRAQKNEILLPCNAESIMKLDFLDVKHKKILGRYVENSLSLIEKKSLTVIHGDLHLNNIVTTPSGIVFIDTDDTRYGHPYMDLVYAANLHYTRQELYQYYMFLQYYFNRMIPDEFWPIVNVFSILKAIEIMRSEIENSCNHQAKFSFDSFLREHKDMCADKPDWYQRIEHEM